MSEKYLKVQNLSISEILFNFINNEIIPGSGIEEKRFWKGFNDSVHQLAEKNRRLIKMREQFQMKIHKRIVDLMNSTSKTVDALMQLDMPAGVDIEIKT